MAERAALVRVLVGFARALREAGLPVGSGDALTYCRAMTALDPSDLVDLYWAGHSALLKRHEDKPRYDEVFRRYFLAADGPAAELLQLTAENHDAAARRPFEHLRDLTGLLEDRAVRHRGREVAQHLPAVALAAGRDQHRPPHVTGPRR